MLKQSLKTLSLFINCQKPRKYHCQLNVLPVVHRKHVKARSHRKATQRDAKRENARRRVALDPV